MLHTVEKTGNNWTLVLNANTRTHKELIEFEATEAKEVMYVETKCGLVKTATNALKEHGKQSVLIFVVTFQVCRDKDRQTSVFCRYCFNRSYIGGDSG